MKLYYLLYVACRIANHIFQQIHNSFWKYYLRSYCKSRSKIFELSSPNDLHFSGRCIIQASNTCKISIGKDVHINSGSITSALTPSRISVLGNSILSIGNNVGMSSISILCRESITIGSHVRIGAGSLIIDSNMHSLNWEQRSTPGLDTINAKKAPVIIEDYVFIGARCIILKGVRIGARSIIAAGSVINKDIPANCIAGGNPCRIIKQL